LWPKPNAKRTQAPVWRRGVGQLSSPSYLLDKRDDRQDGCSELADAGLCAWASSTAISDQPAVRGAGVVQSGPWHCDRAANVIGVISVMVWTLITIVAVKYVVLILRADNRGEGGIMALTALARRRSGAARRATEWSSSRTARAALFCGDGVITPSISVLSAVEGWAWRRGLQALRGSAGGRDPDRLYAVQKTGTDGSASCSADLTVWFVVIGAAGVGSIARAPQILAALDPFRAVDFMQRSGFVGFAALGAIVLA